VTIEEAREYSAIEILGWKLESLPEPFGDDGDLMWDYVSPDYSRECSVQSWRPDQDRDQLWLVLDKLVQDGATDAANWLWQRSDFTSWGAQNGFYNCMAHPARALIAICGAHKENA